MSFVDRPKPGSWKLSRAELDGAINAIRKRRRIDQTHDIPYVAGYSRDGKTLYLDRMLPDTIPIDGKDINIAQFIILHEEIEKALEDEVQLAYLHAHQIALRGELAAVAANGIDWRAYNTATLKLCAKIGARREYPNCPKDLDLTPYKDEKDKQTLARMVFK
jgi:hypothetical protein